MASRIPSLHPVGSPPRSPCDSGRSLANTRDSARSTIRRQGVGTSPTQTRDALLVAVAVVAHLTGGASAPTQTELRAGRNKCRRVVRRTPYERGPSLAQASRCRTHGAGPTNKAAVTMTAPKVTPSWAANHRPHTRRHGSNFKAVWGHPTSNQRRRTTRRRAAPRRRTTRTGTG